MSALLCPAPCVSHADFRWFVAVTYAPHGGRLLDPGQRFLCGAGEGRELERNGWAIADPTAAGVRVVSSWWHEAVVPFDFAGRHHHAGHRFVCPPAVGAALELAGKVIRLPWLAPQIERQVLPPTQPKREPGRPPALPPPQPARALARPLAHSATGRR